MNGLAIFVKKNKLITVGRIENGSFNGFGICIDLSEKTYYCGQMSNNSKDGFGLFQKYKQDEEFSKCYQFISECTNRTY